jgi:hypothetical protein
MDLTTVKSSGPGWAGGPTFDAMPTHHPLAFAPWLTVRLPRHIKARACEIDFLLDLSASVAQSRITRACRYRLSLTLWTQRSSVERNWRPASRRCSQMPQLNFEPIPREFHPALFLLFAVPDAAFRSAGRSTPCAVCAMRKCFSIRSRASSGLRARIAR